MDNIQNNADGDRVFNITYQGLEYHVEMMPRDKGHFPTLANGNTVTVKGLHVFDMGMGSKGVSYIPPSRSCIPERPTTAAPDTQEVQPNSTQSTSWGLKQRIPSTVGTEWRLLFWLEREGFK